MSAQISDNSFAAEQVENYETLLANKRRDNFFAIFFRERFSSSYLS